MKHLIAVGLAVSTLAFSNRSQADWLLVANKGDHTIGLVDPLEGVQVATVAENGTTGHELIASPDGKRAFVPIYGNAGVGHPGTDGQLIRVIDLATRQIVGTIDFGKGVRPHCAQFGPKDGLLYVTTELDQTISVIDPKTLKIVGAIPTGEPESHMLALSSDGKRGYTANVASGTVSVLDIKARKLLDIISVCEVTQRIAISVDNKWVFTSDQKAPRLAVIDAKKKKVAKWIDLPGTGYGGAVTPDGKWFILALPHERKAAVIDLKTMTVAQTISLPRSPQETLVQPDGAKAYISCDTSKQVAVIDTKTWTVTKLIAAGPVVDGLAWAKGE